MFFNIIVIGIALGLAYAWMVRGFFNAFIQMLCTIIAGAIAFALWEKISYLLLGMSPERGFLSFVGSAAWGIGLIAPFAVSLLLLRVIADKIITANIKNNGAVDYAGGAVCGLVTGVICAGFTTIGIQSMRVPSSFLGYQPLWYTEDTGSGGGSLVLKDSLWVPADQITAWIYSGLSTGSMSTGNPLDRWYPNLHASGIAARVSPEGAGRNTIKPDDVRIHASYTVGTADSPMPAGDLLAVSGSTQPQKYTDIHGNPVTQGYLQGYILEFEPGAKEDSGKSSSGAQVIVSNGQFALITEDAAGNTDTVYPIAVISEGQGGRPGQLGRWKFDAREVFISSVGGQSKVKMGFEFVIPAGHTPIAMVVRQTRFLLENAPAPTVLASANDRDLRVRSGSIFDAGSGGRSARELDDARAVTVDGTARNGRPAPFSVSTRVGEVLASQTARSRVDLNENNEIVSGSARFLPEEFAARGIGRELRVESFAVGRGQALVQIDVSLDQPISFLGDAARSAATDAPIMLIDARGGEYEAIGYTYRDRELFEVRYTPSATLDGMRETPSISSARDDQRLTILFIVTEGVDIEQVAVGNTLIARFSPALTADSD